jgi:hypothetical protein
MAATLESPEDRRRQKVVAARICNRTDWNVAIAKQFGEVDFRFKVDGEIVAFAELKCRPKDRWATRGRACLFVSNRKLKSLRDRLRPGPYDVGLVSLLAVWQLIDVMVWADVRITDGCEPHIVTRTTARANGERGVHDREPGVLIPAHWVETIGPGMDFAAVDALADEDVEAYIRANP